MDRYFSVFSVVLFSFFFNIEINAKWISQNSQTPMKVQFQVVKSDQKEIQVSFELPGFEVTPIEILGENFIQVSVPDLTSIEEKGFPALPKFNKDLLVPFDTQTMSLEVIEKEWKVYDLGVVAPSRGTLTDLPPNFGSKNN
ncbi:MAG: hypothetical protein HY843_07790 [Bdellovibrio sp.]|nr:hypothetical protein [Bdellovibrio sp.]